MGFDELVRLRAEMDAFGLPWAFGGGWSIDGRLGRVTRVHADVDICILREDLPRWRAVFPRGEWFFMDGDVERPWGDDVVVSESGLHVRDGAAYYEFLPLRIRAGMWIAEDDARVVMPQDMLFVQGVEGMPFLSPAVALFWKSKKMRPKDLADFDHVLPFLSDFERKWLLQALETVYGGHVWMQRLKEI